MPVTKNAGLRYRLIDECLQRRQKIWKPALLLETIADKFFQATGQELSKSQFNQDIKAMREGGSAGFNAPIECTRERGYYYADPNFSISNSPLVSDDAVVLRQALAALRQFQGFGLSEELDEVVKRVEGHLQARHMGEAEQQLIWFEQVPDYAGTPFLAPLYRAIRGRQVLRLHYRPFGAAEAQVETIHPHYLKEFNRRWFLLASSDARPGMSHFALDRIEQALVAPELTYQPTAVLLDEYFRDVIGVSVPAEMVVAEVRLLFRQGRGQYVRTKPLHASQKIERETGDEMEVSLRLGLNPELETVLLSFGNDVEVLAPLQLRQRLRARLVAAAKRYD
jgi:predicted DNA-binding transcriptional regulator YafY